MNTKDYWFGWPLKCKYTNELKYVNKVVSSFLIKKAEQCRNNGKDLSKYLVVFDLDETLFMGDPKKTLQLSPMTYVDPSNKNEYIFILPPNKSIVDIAKLSHKLGFTNICITARPMDAKDSSIHNLKMYDIPYNALIMNDKEQDPCFKIKQRIQLSSDSREIICTIGDQLTDLFLPGPNACAVKLPNEDLACAYIYLPM